MRLRAYDTVHVSMVKAENLRPGEEFEIADADGKALMKAHPRLFAEVEAKAAPRARNKAEPDPANKAAQEPENKSEEIAPISATPRRSVPRT